MIGIYKITNLVNEKCYVGQSVNIHKRFIAHKNSAFNEHSKSYDSPLSRAIRKYTLDNFSFEILEECSIDELDDKEIFYIAKYQAYGKCGYNRDPGGKRALHYIKLSEDIVDQIIETLKTSMDNSDEIGEQFGVSGRTIRAINSGESCHREYETYPIRPPLFAIEIDKKNNSEHNQNKKYQHKKSEYYCKTCGTKITKYSNYCVECGHKEQRKTERPSPLELAKMIKEFGFLSTGKYFGVSENTIKKWCKTYQIPHLKNELINWYNIQMNINDDPVIKKEKIIQNKQVKQIDPKTKNVLNVFESVNSAARSFGKKKGTHISEVCNGIHKTAYGFEWEYI